MSYIPSYSIGGKLSLINILADTSLLAFIAFISLGHILHPQGPSIIIWCLQCVPLLILIPSMLRKNPRSYIWLCFIILVYFIALVERVMSPSRNWLNMFQLFLVSSIFITAMFTSRWLQQEHGNRNTAKTHLSEP